MTLRLRLVLWAALVLGLLIGGFGFTLYTLQRRALYDKVDGRLRAHALAMAGSLKTESGLRFEFELTDEYVKTFRQGGDDAPYYVLWDRQGRIIDRSSPKLELPRPEGPHTRRRSGRREVVVPGPQDSLVLVGQGIEDEKEELQELLGAVLGSGAGVMVLALLGAWFLASRALRPIERITRAAEAVTAASLSGRIDESRMERELRGLVRSLNGAFDRLEKAFDRQARFTADASHELRTPLSIVMTQAELALRKERTPEEYRLALGTALQAAQRMKAVVEGLLTLARADAKETNLRRERVDLGKVVEETAAMLSTLAGERRVKMKVLAMPVEVDGDPERLREAVANLVTNAIRYNREEGQVEVALRAQDGQAVLEVADTGIGIPEKDRPQLFERFFRVDKGRSREQGGSGLGLAITKWIVEAHGGTISFAGREGGGTTFTVRLPRAAGR